jgi:crotonobetainyl-CoA:carnitine CoA-transferase CaiB-like acyl-CoA transferase
MTNGPLRGLRVIDCSTTMAGLRATGLLAAYGADVVWVEPEGGSRFRTQWPEAASVCNRLKRSIVLDLSETVQRDELFRLVSTADVFVETWSPGWADAAGLGYSALKAWHEALVYCSISGFGPDGPHRDLAGHESLVHALVGTMAEQAGHRDGPIFEGVPMAGLGASYLAVIGALAALYRRSLDGIGRQVETSLLDGALAYHAMLWSESDQSVRALAAKGGGPNSTEGTRLITRSFVCSDGDYLGIHTGAVGAFGRLMTVLELDDRIPPSPSGLDMGVPLTPDQMDLLTNELHRLIAAKPRPYWVETLRAAEVCAIEHLSPTEVFDQAQARHNEMVVEVDDPALGRLEQVGIPAKFPAFSPAGPLTGAPMAGQHADEVRAEQRDGAAGDGRWRIGPEIAAATPSGGATLLDGVTILDVGAYFAGPYSSRLLADLGAEVIKLEPTQGDQLRGIDQCFFPAQAGKSSIAMNLKDPAVRPIVEGLLEWADVVHHNLRPGAAERLGLGWDDIHADHPELVYLYAPGWGSSGPDRLRQSFAPMMSGYVGVTFEAAGRFNEPLPCPCNEDPGNGMLGAACILMGLLERRHGGDGLYIENPQLNATMFHLAHIVRRPDGTVLGAGRLDPLQYGLGPLERLYETADGWVCLVALDADDTAAVGQVLGVEMDLTDDDTLGDRLASAMATRSTSSVRRDLRRVGVAAVEPVGRNAAAFLADPENRRTGRVAECRHPAKGNVREVAQLLRVSSTSVPPHRLAPDLGADTDRILTSLGLMPDEVATLRDRGAVR